MAKKQDIQQQQRIVKNLPDASIPYNTSFIGDIGTLGGIRIDGNLKGKVSAGGNVTVGADGSIEGCVTACDVNIAGEILGNLKATGTVQMLSGAKLVGDLTASSFAIEQGAYFKGQCLISNGKEPASRNVPEPEPELKKVDLKKTAAADKPAKS
ncbi:MAG: polymer-forming cytoskeletal protein [Christensenellales bacterium]